ncbi:MAG: MBL fold metallo-hydrolase [Verrucomicrobiota bacterium]
MLEISSFCGGFCSTNGYLVRNPGNGQEILVDAPLGILDWMKETGVRPGALLLTHQHFDHVEEVAMIVQEFGVKVYGWSPVSEQLTLEKWAVEAGAIERIETFSIDCLLEEMEEGELLKVAELSFELLHVPGHSPDSVCFYLSDSELVFVGDVLMSGGYGRTDLPHGNASELFQGIREKMWTLPEGTHVLSGHGPPTTIEVEKANGLIPV